MRVLLVYPGPLFSVYDVARGYERGLAEAGADVGVYPYHNWLKFYHVTFGLWNGQEDVTPIGDDAAHLVASEHVVIKAVDVVPDVVLIVAGLALHRRAFELLAHLSLPVAVLLTESPYEDGTQLEMMRKGHVALAFTNERTSAASLEAEAGVRTLYLPHAYDPARHWPRRVNGDYYTDVFFHGTMWPERERMRESIIDLPYNIHFAGVETRDKPRPLMRVLADTIDNEDMPLWYSGTRIALNHHRQFCTVGEDREHYLSTGEAESLGPRAYEIAACGAFQLCDDSRAELGDVFGDSVATYAGIDDLRDKIEYYLWHDTERREMARAARERVRGCTFADRAREIVLPALESIAIRR